MCKRGRDVSRKIGIDPLKETNLVVAELFLHTGEYHSIKNKVYNKYF